MSKAKRILIIDDSEVVLERMKRVLYRAGYDVVTTTQIVGNARYLPTCDLVIVDYHMPGLNGEAVVESMRSTAQTMKHVCPIFLYTSDERIAASYKEHGFDGVFADKGDEQSLLRQITSFFRIQEIRAAREAAPSLPPEKHSGSPGKGEDLRGASPDTEANQRTDSPTAALTGTAPRE